MEKRDISFRNPLFEVCRYGFYLSVLLLFYGTLFPFHFDFSSHGLSQAWSETKFAPFWDTQRGRIHSLPDMASNALLTVPLGFFGFLFFGERRKPQSIAKWFAIGFSLGLLAEIIQLGIPWRSSDITDALNNGLGALAGAGFASLFGSQILDLLSGSLLDEKSTYFVILLGIATATMLLPFDFSLDVHHLKSSLKHLWLNPWESGVPIETEWIKMVLFAMLGALAGSIAAPRLNLFALLLPFILEPAQLLLDSHAPSLRDLAMNFAGLFCGWAASRIFPSVVRPRTGFILMNVALVAQGLSPYQFAGRSHFEWIPLVEYYNQTTGAALYDAMAGLLSYGLLAALWPKRTTILWAVLLASGIEVAQIFLAVRFAGTTDILIAGIGAWVGYTVSKAVPHGVVVRAEMHDDILMKSWN